VLQRHGGEATRLTLNGGAAAGDGGRDGGPLSSIATTRDTARRLIHPQVRGFMVGFGATLLAALLVTVGAALAIGLMNQGRVLPGVSIGGVELGGLDRAAAEDRLASVLPSLATGAATLEIGGQAVTVPYAEIGRGYELGAMADAAFGTGREANPVASTIARLRDVVHGTVLPVQVHAYDLDAINNVAIQLALRFATPAVDASVAVDANGVISVTPAQAGAALDPRVVRGLLGAAVATDDPADMTLEIPLETRQPSVTTAAAQAAAAAARVMTGSPLTLTDGTDAFTLDGSTLASVIRFGLADDGTFGAQVDPLALGSVVSGLAGQIDREAVDASYAFGTKVTVVPAVEGRALDESMAATEISRALKARAAGESPGSISLPVTVTQPSFTTEAAQASVAKIVRIGTWTTHYVPGVSNGYGVNISIPARHLNGLVVAPGETFDFWSAIGPVTTAQGYRYGGAIINGKSEPTGALAGGICSTSTTLFNAALRSGLQMGARTNHFYYISRYPVGLDATVFADGASVTTMSWTNDTDYPVIIRSITTYGVVRFDLYSVPTGRTVTLTSPVITNRVAAHDVIQYTTSLKPGVEQRVEGVYNGFDASVTRYVRAADGTVIHKDTYFSHYHPVNGLLLIGKSTSTPAPSPTPPPPSPAPSPGA
jgi:vancomycin resistance protein YoaR